MVPTPEIVNAYTAVLERAILSLRMRLRYSEEVTPDEVHDLMDALHNIPIMLRNYGGWHVEENIDYDLAHYDKKWLSVPGSTLRSSLVGLLERARLGEFNR
jgi:hypothetical protein